MVLDFLAVLRMRRVLEVMFEILASSFKLTELEAEKAAVPELSEVLGVDHQHHVDDGEALIGRVSLEVNVLQIVEHPPQNLTGRDARKKPVAELQGVSIPFMQPVAAVVAGEDFTAVVRIDEELFAGREVLHDEVARHPYSGDWKVQAAGYLDVYRR